MNSSYHPEVMRLTVPVLQTKLTPCAECVVRCEKALLTFWRDVHRRLSTWTLRHNVALKVLFFEILTSSLLTLLVLAGGAQSVVRVRKCSRILGCSCLCRTHFRLSQQGVRGCTICRPQWDEAVKG